MKVRNQFLKGSKNIDKIQFPTSHETLTGRRLNAIQSKLVIAIELTPCVLSMITKVLSFQSPVEPAGLSLKYTIR